MDSMAMLVITRGYHISHIQKYHVQQHELFAAGASDIWLASYWGRPWEKRWSPPDTEFFAGTAVGIAGMSRLEHEKFHWKFGNSIGNLTGNSEWNIIGTCSKKSPFAFCSICLTLSDRSSPCLGKEDLDISEASHPPSSDGVSLYKCITV